MSETGWYRPIAGAALPIAALRPPLHLPMVLGSGGREMELDVSWAALPFHLLFRVQKGKLVPVATTPQELRYHFLLAPDVRVAAISSNFDKHLERMWEFHRTLDMGAALGAMGVAFATAPNFSFWGFAPKHHNQWNARRSALFAARLWDSGLPTLPHIYAETDGDWLDRAVFFRDHPQLDGFAMEFQTVDGERSRIPALRRQLALFIAAVGRPLHLVVSGGVRAAHWLPQVLDSITIVEAESYSKATRRRLLSVGGRGGLRASGVVTDEPVGALMAQNVRAIADALAFRCELARDRMAKTRTAAA